MKYLTEREVRGLIEHAIQKAGGVRALARKLGCSPTHISDMRKGKRFPGPRLALALGFRVLRTVVYERIFTPSTTP